MTVKYNQMSKGTRSMKNLADRFIIKRKDTASCDKTEQIDCDEPQVKLQVFGKKTVRAYNNLLLVTPNALLNFGQLITKLDSLLRAPKDKAKVLRFIASNMQEHGIDNIKNLEAIEDDHFWLFTAPELIGFLKNSLPEMKYIPIIKAKPQGITDLNRWDVLCLIGCMFLGIIPKQAHDDSVTFGELMSCKQGWAGNLPQRRQKLMCIMAYFRSFFKNESIHDQPIRIKRTSNSNKSYLNPDVDRSLSLSSMTILKRQQKTMEDHQGSAIMINPSSKKLGGNVLRGGCSQEDALMLIMPELIVMKLLCEPLQSDEAIVFYGARKYSKVTLKGNELEFNGVILKQKANIDTTSVVVSINASDYTVRSDIQYSKKEIHSEINKAFAGFEGAAFEYDDQLPVCTGKWGCSKSSNGDEDLKLLIQWLAASQARRNIIYLTDSEEKLKEYKALALELSSLSTLDLLSLLQGYSHQRPKFRKPISVLDYLKYYL